MEGREVLADERYREYVRWVSEEIANQCGFSGEEEDLAQETYKRILEKPDFKEGRGIKGWISRVCMNIAIDMARKKRAETGYDFDREARNDGIAEYERLEQIIYFLKIAWNEAEPSERRAFKGVLEGKSLREIGEKEGLGRCAANTRLWRLGRRLESQGVHYDG